MPVSHGSLTRHGRWLVLIWAPLLLGAYVIAAVQDQQWRDGVLLLVTGAVFLVTVITFHRPSSALGRTVPAWLSLILLSALVGITLVTVRIAETSELSFMTISLLAIAAAVVLPPRVVPGVVILIGLASGVGALIAGWGWGVASWLSIVTALSGIGTHVVHRLAATNAELHQTRQQLAEAAVSAERMRFSRDLHDLLGHTLSVIVVKAEAVHRLAAADPAASARHGAEIETLGRSALTEVRQAVANYREGSLEEETSRAAAAMRAGGVEPDIGHIPPGLDPGAEQQLAWVVREATTNVLRHSTASTCQVRVTRNGGWIRLTVGDDGHGGPGSTSGGTGLVGLRERLAQRGGNLTVEHSAEGFMLTAEVPAASADAAVPALQEHR
ncbi:sensor histidine kinase [Ornithinimicrobium cryptoxanthini]|uniref:Histidine kinase n=1 Tax=Ornithinimicrobium cryptoxanthini TaxID=2934161 RepID=A0ABY4YJ93_9MICO|nr:histidine kinase [Ornithinimicrobium cryptoxanthini]USQ76871.1 histidine kinase [Ornithinimicrobium cryptoxanthini]